jgi:hypothetical protein
METTGVEPATSWLQTTRSPKLSYVPGLRKRRSNRGGMVELQSAVGSTIILTCSILSWLARARSRARARRTRVSASRGRTRSRPGS